MAKLNILSIKIKNLLESIDEHVLFAFKDVEDYSLKLKEYDHNGNKTHDHVLITLLQDYDSISSLNFYEIYTGKGLITSSDSEYELIFNNCRNRYLISLLHLKKKVSHKTSIQMDGYALSLFLYCLKFSQCYIQYVSNYLVQHLSSVKRFKIEQVTLILSGLQIVLVEPRSHVMDLTWAKMACHAIHELRQLQYALSWLSTLGGAYSALGEGRESCARNAGLISLEQLKLALRLGNDIVITQCKLYFSLSLIQQGYCHRAKAIILQQYNKVKSSPVVDRRTLNMCKGIWARLRYEMHKCRENKRKATHRLCKENISK